MTVVASANVSCIEEFKGVGKAYRLVPTIKKDGSSGKPTKELLYLNLEIDGEDVESILDVFKSVNPEKSIIKLMTILGDAPENLKIPSIWKGRVFSYNGRVVVDGLTNLVLTGEDVPNLYDLYLQAKENPTYRFVGGKLLAVEGVPIGYFDEGIAKEFGILGKEQPKAVFEYPNYDFFENIEMHLVLDAWGTDLIKEGFTKKKVKSPKVTKPKVTKLSVKKPKVAKPKTSKPKTVSKVTKKKEAFSSIFSNKVEF